MAKSFKDVSREIWSPSGAVQREDLNTGSLQRIADALEKIANTQSEIVREANEARVLRRRLAHARGEITKLQNKLNAPA